MCHFDLYFPVAVFDLQLGETTKAQSGQQSFSLLLIISKVLDVSKSLIKGIQVSILSRW